MSGVGVTVVRTAINAQRLRARRVGRAWHVNGGDLCAWLEPLGAEL